MEQCCGKTKEGEQCSKMIYPVYRIDGKPYCGTHYKLEQNHPPDPVVPVKPLAEEHNIPAYLMAVIPADFLSAVKDISTNELIEIFRPQILSIMEPLIWPCYQIYKIRKLKILISPSQKLSQI